MIMHERASAGNVVRAILIAAAGMSSLANVQAAAYPDHPIRFIVPSAPGGGPDTVARLISAELVNQMGQQVVVDNRPGGAFVIGMDAIAKAPRDGYTIGYGSVGPLAISRHLSAKLPYDPDKDFQAISQVGMSQCIIGVNPASPIKSVRDLIDTAKKNPDKLTYGASNGSISHLSAELFNQMAGTKIVHVSYKNGAQAITDVMGKQVDMVFGNLPEIWSHVRSGKIRGLAVTGPHRSPGFPELPRVADVGVPGYEAVTWGGIVGPAGMPKDIGQRLNVEINKAIATPTFKEKYAAIGNEPLGGTPEAFARFIHDESAKWGKVVKRLGTKMD
jgi:tripartite-type tricarboxylate transporter receptor subunit TctC